MKRPRPETDQVKVRFRLLRHLIAHRPFRFLVVGVVNTAFAYSIFLAGLALGLWPTPALIVSNILGVTFNFFTVGMLTFGSRDVGRAPAFYLAYAFLFVVNAVSLKIAVAFGARPAIAQAALVLPLAALSYIIQRDLVFRAKRGAGTAA